MLLEYDFGFVQTITRFLAADRLAAASVNIKFEAKYSVAYAGFIKHILVLLNHHLDFPPSSKVNMGADASDGPTAIEDGFGWIGYWIA